jgi:hypothetical protein
MEMASSGRSFLPGGGDREILGRQIGNWPVEAEQSVWQEHVELSAPRRPGPRGAAGKCFAFVQTFDHKPKRRLFELLKNQGMQENQ